MWSGLTEAMAALRSAEREFEAARTTLAGVVPREWQDSAADAYAARHLEVCVLAARVAAAFDAAELALTASLAEASALPGGVG